MSDTHDEDASPIDPGTLPHPTSGPEATSLPDPTRPVERSVDPEFIEAEEPIDTDHETDHDTDRDTERVTERVTHPDTEEDTEGDTGDGGDDGDEPVDPATGGEESEPADEGFASLGLRPELLKAIADLGYEEPTPIQRETIPHLIAGHDLLGQAATGTGKTAAFALPALQGIDTSKRAEPSVLVLVPTRELAVQVSEAMFKYGKELGVKVVPVFGGQPIQRQLQMLDRGVHVVVATPGRAIDHIGRGSLKLDAIRTVILDEADEMLDMGFTDDIESILQSTPDDRQTVLFSATLPHRINAIAKRYQRDPVKIKIGRTEAESGEKALVRQTVYWVQRAHKATCARVGSSTSRRPSRRSSSAAPAPRSTNSPRR